MKPITKRYSVPVYVAAKFHGVSEQTIRNYIAEGYFDLDPDEVRKRIITNVKYQNFTTQRAPNKK